MVNTTMTAWIESRFYSCVVMCMNRYISMMIESSFCYAGTFYLSIFAHDVGGANWNEVMYAGTVDDAVAAFNFIFLQIVNKHLPWRKIRCRISKSPWITSEYLSFVDRREYFARNIVKSQQRNS